MILQGFRSGYIIAAIRRFTLATAVFLCLAAISANPGKAQDKPSGRAPTAGVQPQVQILILQLNPTGVANVALTYPGTETMESAQKDIDEIGTRTGWKITSPTMTNNAPTTPQRPSMSSVEFMVPNTLPISSSPNGRGFPIEPLIIALKRFKEIELVFAMRPDFKFRGLTDFDNDYVRIRLRKGGQTYSYRVEIKRSDFTKLDLPVIVEPRSASPQPQKHSILWPLVISLSIGLIVWLLTQAAKRQRKA